MLNDLLERGILLNSYYRYVNECTVVSIYLDYGQSTIPGLLVPKLLLSFNVPLKKVGLALLLDSE